MVSMAQMPLYDERFAGYGKNKILSMPSARRRMYVCCMYVCVWKCMSYIHRMSRDR